MKIKILAVGKLKEKAYQSRIVEYVKWINKDVPVELIFLKDNDKVNKKKKIKDFLKFKINSKLMSLSKKAILLHCLPW